jgi:hypothetical protein
VLLVSPPSSWVAGRLVKGEDRCHKIEKILAVYTGGCQIR